MRERPLAVGDPVPWFECRAAVSPRFHFDTVAGRYIVLCFFESAAEARSARVLADVLRRRALFDMVNLQFFGVSADPEDERARRVQDVLPGIQFFWDFERKVAAACGASGRRLSYLLDERLRVIAVLPFEEDAEGHVERLAALIRNLPALPAQAQAPVLVVPRVFEPALCRRLIEEYERQGGKDSGFMRDVDGKTVGIYDYGHKRRRDAEIEDAELRRACMARVHDRLAPEILKAYQFRATRMERYIVSCYDAAEGGHFRAHRDNTTSGTAHRRFAVSLFLNTGEYEGGELGFPEFGRSRYSAEPGGAVVFSCSLLHEATPVTRGKRYMFLPFLYDDAAAARREEYLRSTGSAA